MKNVAVLGSTGSIGIQALDIIRLHPGRFKVTTLAAGGSNPILLTHQVQEFRPSLVSLPHNHAVAELKTRLGSDAGKTDFTTSISDAAIYPDVDIVVGGLPGSAGLAPTFAAVEAGKNVALATKEVLVMAGRLFMDRVRHNKVALLPVDSEQSAIFQCLEGNKDSAIRRLILTASGGPFRDIPADEMAAVTVERTLDHPRWKMGQKVTVDSATLMNKGLEVIEAKWLFNVPASHIEVVIHPQSVCHSMVEFQDGSIMAQLGATDMRIPISYALAYPERIESGTEPVNFPELGQLTFQKPDLVKFPLLQAAYTALMDQNDSACIVLNAADEVAVELFLDRKIPFNRISEIVLNALDTIPARSAANLEEVIAFHEYVVARVRQISSIG
jgi:1-deoxy-D-xylulose-5-phosphate reductoisomerase